MPADLDHLTPEQRTLLEASAIAPEVTDARGYRYLDAEQAAAELPALGFEDYQITGSGLLVPMYGPDGSNGGYQFRADSPRFKDDKPVKYETPEGAKNMLDIHPSKTYAVINPEATLVLTEGVKTADSMTSLGCLTGALSGCHSWKTKDDDDNSIVLPEFDDCPQEKVTLVWDSDATTNPNVMHGLRGLRDELVRRGKTVEAFIPPGSNGEKVGMDDFLAAGGSWGGLVPLDLDNVTPLISSAGDVDAGEFFLDRPKGVPAVWGKGNQVLWADGEPLMIAALEGLGKTTDGQRLGFGLIAVPGFEEFLGFPIRPLPEDKNVVYLALDRPNQISRSGGRMIAPEHRELVSRRMKVWKGALPFDMTREPEKLLPFLLERNAGAVVFDSLKDVVARLSDEEAAATFMRGIGLVIAAGIQVLILHHNRKPNAENKKPKTLADIHGSTNFSRGCGSVITYWAPAAGATEVELNHVKPPAEPVGPFVIERDHATGNATRGRSGAIKTDAKSKHKATILAHYRESGGTGVMRTWKQLEEVTGVTINTLRGPVAELQSEGWLVIRPAAGQGAEVQIEMVEKII